MNLKVNAKLDPKFAPMSIVCRDMREATKADGQDIVIAVERNKGYTTTYKTRIFKDGTGKDAENFAFVERIVKTLLWVAGGYKIIIAGSDTVAQKIAEAYSYGGARDFDVKFMERVYEEKFSVESVALADAPKDKSSASPVGRHLDGCRIGFDAGGSDRKVSAVIDGESVTVIAEKLGYTDAGQERMVRYFESGKRPVPLDKIRPLAAALNLTLDDLIP